MTLKLLKTLALIALAAIIVVTVYGMADYWLGLAVFPFVSVVMTGAFHLIVLVMLTMAFIHLYKYKV